jgi:hypothetical protein
MGEKLTRAEKSAINRAKWAQQPPLPRKGGLTREQMSALRREAYRLGRVILATGDGRMAMLSNPNADFVLPELSSLGSLPTLPPLKKKKG